MYFQGEHTLHTEDILQCIDDNLSELALIVFSGMEYQTGKLFDIKTITQYAREKVAFCYYSYSLSG